MIKNKKQYTALIKEVEILNDHINDLEKLSLSDKNIKPELKLQLNDFKRLLKKYEQDIKEYEHLTSPNLKVLEFDSSKNDMNKAIMSFRIASQYTQKRIAELMYIQEQQIQRYEQQDYLSAGFERILQLLEALGVQIILKKEFKQFDFILPADNDRINELSEKIKLKKQVVEFN